MTTARLTASQYITQRVGTDAETICALLSDIEALNARIAELEKIIADGERPTSEAGDPA